MCHIKVIAFDCDGVMFNSEKANTAYYDQILHHVGLPAMTREQFAYVHMHTVGEALAYLFPEGEMLRAAYAFSKNTGYFDFIKLMEIEPYLKTLLENLRPSLKTAVATNRTNTMGQVLKAHGLDAQFDLVVCALDVAQPKPYPDMLVKVLDHFGVTAQEMLFVGDSSLDAQAAHAAGVPFVAYGNGSLPAAHHITTLKALEDIIGFH
ncbi:MAG: HAD-IA family hydrolase [Pseudomonadota bacterium]